METFREIDRQALRVSVADVYEGHAGMTRMALELMDDFTAVQWAGEIDRPYKGAALALVTTYDGRHGWLLWVPSYRDMAEVTGVSSLNGNIKYLIRELLNWAIFAGRDRERGYLEPGDVLPR